MSTKKELKGDLCGSHLHGGRQYLPALTSILAKIGIEGVNSNLATAVRTMAVVMMSWGMEFLTDAQGGIKSISQRSWIFRILSGLATASDDIVFAFR